MPSNRPLPQDEATPRQHETIIKCVCHELGINWWQSPDMNKVADYINRTFNLNLDTELEPLSKQEASRIITHYLGK